MNKTNELQVLNFEEQQVRMLEKDGQPWWVLADVCKVLGLSNPTKVSSRLDDDERSNFKLGRQGKATIVNESGLYSVIIRSDKPAAKKFKRWITHEVLPSIRKTGSYIGEDTSAKLTEQLTQAVTLIVQTAAVMARVVDKLEVLTEKLLVQPVITSTAETTLLQDVPDNGLYYNNKCKLETFPAHIVSRVEEMLVNMQEQQSLNFSQIARWCTVNGYTISSPAVKTYFNRHFANA